MQGVLSYYYQNADPVPVPNPIFQFDPGDFVSANGLISQWNDSSGNGNHLKQATASARPIHGTVGSNLFTGATGTNWSGSGNGPYTHSTGSAVDLSADVLTDATRYLVETTVASRTAGSITPKAGTTVGTAISANGTTSEVLLSAGTNAIFTPTSDFDGTVTANFKAITTADKAYFDGIQRLLKADAFTEIPQPLTIYMAVKQVTHTSGRRFFALSTSVNRLDLLQSSNGSPKIALVRSSEKAPQNFDLAVDTDGVVVAIFNDDASLIQVDNNSPTIIDIGASTPGMNIVYLGSAQDPAAFGNIEVTSVIGYEGAHSASQIGHNVNYLNSLL